MIRDESTSLTVILYYLSTNYNPYKLCNVPQPSDNNKAELCRPDPADYRAYVLWENVSKEYTIGPITVQCRAYSLGHNLGH